MNVKVHCPTCGNDEAIIIVPNTEIIFRFVRTEHGKVAIEILGINPGSNISRMLAENDPGFVYCSQCESAVEIIYNETSYNAKHAAAQALIDDLGG